MLGENGTGKTTFIRMLAGMLKPDNELEVDLDEFAVSYKPQKISPKFPGTVSGVVRGGVGRAVVHMWGGGGRWASLRGPIQAPEDLGQVPGGVRGVLAARALGLHNTALPSFLPVLGHMP